MLGVQSLTLLSCVGLWKNLNRSEFHFLLLEEGTLPCSIEAYKYKVLSKEIAYTKQLVNASSLMRQVWESCSMKGACRAEIRTDLHKLGGALGPALLVHGILHGFWFGPFVLDLLQSHKN